VLYAIYSGEEKRKSFSKVFFHHKNLDTPKKQNSRRAFPTKEVEHPLKSKNVRFVVFPTNENKEKTTKPVLIVIRIAWLLFQE
jgi:hypothetical protein